MLSKLLLVSALATATLAQGLIPTCAQPCIGDFGGCSTLQAECICKNTKYLDSLRCCVSTSCTPEQQAGVIAFAQSICSPIGVNINTSLGCASGTGTATTAPSTSSGTPTANPAAASSTSSKGLAHQNVGSGAAGLVLAGLMAAF